MSAVMIFLEKSERNRDHKPYIGSEKSTKYKERSTNVSGKDKVRRTNNGRLVPNFVLRHSYIVLQNTLQLVASPAPGLVNVAMAPIGYFWCLLKNVHLRLF
jgi:hypothetical protein